MIASTKNLKKLFSFCEWVFVFFLILSTNSVYYVAASGFTRKIITYAMYILPMILGLCSLLLLIKLKSTFSNAYIYFYIGYVVYFTFLIFTLVYPYGQNLKVFIIKFLIFPFSYLLYFRLLKGKKINSFFVKFSTIVHIIAAISVFFWFLGSVIHLFVSTSSLVINWGSTYTIPSFWGIYFETQSMQIFGLNIVRNTAIFTEPPMFSFILLITLLGDLFYLKSGYKNIIFLFIVMITSGSALGISTAVIVIVYYYVRKLMYININKYLKRSKLVIVMFCFISLMFVGLVLYNRFKNGGSSANIHIQDFVTGYQAWIQHPLFGNGLNNFQSITNYMNVNRLAIGGNSGISSGLVYILAYGGIYWGVFYILPLILDIIFNVKNNPDFIVVDIVVLVLIVLVETYNLNLTIILLMLIWQHFLDKDVKFML